MKFLVEILGGSSFEIEVENKDTLLEVKQKIEKSQSIPVYKQTFIADGIVILREDLTVEQCQIVHDSCLQLDLSYDNSDYQMPQTEPSPAPWVSVEEHFERQGWPLTAEEIRKIYSSRPETTQETSKNQDLPVMVGSSSKGLHQTEQSPPLKSVQDSNVQDSPVTVGSSSKNHQGLHQTEQSPPLKSVQDIVNVQDSPVTVGSSSKNYQVLHQTEQSPPLKSVQDIVNVQDSPVTVGSSSKNHQTRTRNLTFGSPWSSSTEHIINSPQDSPVAVGSNIDRTIKRFIRRRNPPSTSTENIIISPQDSTTVTQQLAQTEQSPASNSVREITDIIDPPVNDPKKI